MSIEYKLYFKTYMEISRQIVNREAYLARIINRRIINTLSNLESEPVEGSNRNQEADEDEINVSNEKSEDYLRNRCSEDFPDFRTYPLKIDWREVENE